MQHTLTVWLKQTRANFLVLAVLLALGGIALSKALGFTPGLLDSTLIVIGTVLAHTAVNLFNEYSDHRTGIDLATTPTPFSGGSGMPAAGHTSPRAVLIAATASLLLALPIALYFSFKSHWLVMGIAIAGATAAVLYTPFFARIMLGELVAGLTLGSLVIIGGMVALTGNHTMPWEHFFQWRFLLAAFPAGALTFNLLLLNEFPDREADRTGGRHHLVIVLGYRGAAVIYLLMNLAAFAAIAVLPLAGYSRLTWLALAPLPLALKASVTALRHGHDTARLIPAMGQNVLTVLLTDGLLAAGFFLS